MSDIDVTEQSKPKLARVAVIGDRERSGFEEIFQPGSGYGESFELTFPDVSDFAQIERIADQGAVAVAIGFLPAKKADPMIQEANRLGLPVIVFGSEDGAFSGEVISRISTDPYQAGRLAGITMIDAVGEGAVPLGVVSYRDSEFADHRIRGIEDSLGRFQRSRLEQGPVFSTTQLPISLVAAQEVGGLFVFQSEALSETANALEKASKQAEVSVVGFGGGKEALELLDLGRVNCLIGPETDALVEMTLQTIAAVISGSEIEAAQWVDPAVVFRD